MALLWAAGIIYFAVSIGGLPSSPGGSNAAANQPTDVTGATITDEQANNFQQALNGL